MNKKGNISILVIFILLASSLLGVLAMNFVQSMMKQSATTFNYYQSYYLAKAGVELGLSELRHRGVGFEQTFSDTGFVSANFRCAGRCTMSFDLLGMSTDLSQQFGSNGPTGNSGTVCQNPFVLSKGDSLIVPLFRDDSIGNFTQAFTSGVSYDNLFSELDTLEIAPQEGGDEQVNFGLLILVGENLADNGIFFKTGTLEDGIADFLTAFDNDLRPLLGSANLGNSESMYRLFFILSNPGATEVSFCVTSKEALPMQQYYLKSRGMYDKQQLGLEAIYKQPIPDFLLNAYMSY